MKMPKAAFSLKLNTMQKWAKRTFFFKKHDGFQDQQRCKANKIFHTPPPFLYNKQYVMLHGNGKGLFHLQFL